MSTFLPESKLALVQHVYKLALVQYVYKLALVQHVYKLALVQHVYKLRYYNTCTSFDITTRVQASRLQHVYKLRYYNIEPVGAFSMFDVEFVKTAKVR